MDKIAVGDYIRASALFGNDKMHEVLDVDYNQVVILVGEIPVNLSMNYIEEIWVRKA